MLPILSGDNLKRVDQTDMCLIFTTMLHCYITALFTATFTVTVYRTRGFAGTSDL